MATTCALIYSPLLINIAGYGKRNFRTPIKTGALGTGHAHVTVHEILRLLVPLKHLCDQTAPHLCHLQYGAQPFVCGIH